MSDRYSSTTDSDYAKTRALQRGEEPTDRKARVLGRDHDAKGRTHTIVLECPRAPKSVVVALMIAHNGKLKMIHWSGALNDHEASESFLGYVNAVWNSPARTLTITVRDWETWTKKGSAPLWWIATADCVC